MEILACRGWHALRWAGAGYEAAGRGMQSHLGAGKWLGM